MKEGHSQNIDPRPKRRIDKDNPYKLFTVGASSQEPHYFIQFKDGSGIEHCLEIEKPLFEMFDQFELDDLSHMNEADRRYEHSDLTESTLNRRAFDEVEPLETTVLDRMESDELHSAILKLPEIQRRRLLLYYYGGLTHQQIADIEHCSQSAVAQTISLAIARLKNFFNRDL